MAGRREFFGHGDQSGQSTVEYIFLLAMVSAIVIGSFRLILEGMDSGILSVGRELEKTIQSGRHTIGLWKDGP